MTDEVTQSIEAVQVQEPVQAPVEQSAPVESSSFISSLPEDLRNDASLADFKDVTGLAKSYVSSQRMLGNSVRIPGEDASAEAHNEFLQKIQQVPGVVKLPNGENADEVNAFYQKLGKPASAEEYNFSSVEGQEVDINTISNFKDMAHQLNLTNQQADALVKFEVERERQYAEGLEESRNASMNSLKEKWGPDYNNRIEGAKAALSMYEDQFPEAVAELKAGALGNNPAVVSMLSELYGSLKESGANVPATTATNYGMSSEEAKSQINEILSNPQHDYWVGGNQERQKAIERMTKLNTIAYGE